MVFAVAITTSTAFILYRAPAFSFYVITADLDPLDPEIDPDLLLGPYAREYCWDHASLAEAEGESLEYIFEITQWHSLKIAYTWRMPGDYCAYRHISRGMTLQHLAAYYGISSIFEQIGSTVQKAKLTKEQLPGSRSDLDPKDCEGRTPLWYAACNGQRKVVKLLLGSERVDVNLPDKDQKTPLSKAVENDHENIVRLLLQNTKINADLPDWNQQTPFAIAARNCHENIVRLLLQNAQVDVNSRDHIQQASLAIAAERGHEYVVRLLLARTDVDCNACDDDKQTPLHRAAYNGHENIAKMLLDKEEVLIWTKHSLGWTPLYNAVHKGHAQIVRLFLERNLIDVDSKDYSDSNETLLECAARKGCAEIVRLLLETGEIDMNVHDLSQPFAQAVADGSEEIVKLLLETGTVNTRMNVEVSTISREDSFSGTASEIAKHFKHRSILELIGDHEDPQMQEDAARYQLDESEDDQSDDGIQLISMWRQRQRANAS
ncbi:unnamed protein product [Cercospora beticola]|nr:unnamed protein product [Cercospora beticola]